MKDGSTIYDHFNETEPVSLPIDLDALAKLLESNNYGTVRFLGALLRVRKRLHAERIAEYRAKGHLDIAANVEREGDAIADAIESLLKAEEF